MRLVARFTLSASASSVMVSGLGVGHFEDGGDAAHDRGAAAGFEVFLVFGTGFAQMHLAVDHAGQDVKPGAVDHFAGLVLAEMADARRSCRPRSRCRGGPCRHD